MRAPEKKVNIDDRRFEFQNKKVVSDERRYQQKKYKVKADYRIAKVQ